MNLFDGWLTVKLAQLNSQSLLGLSYILIGLEITWYSFFHSVSISCTLLVMIQT